MLICLLLDGALFFVRFFMANVGSKSLIDSPSSFAQAFHNGVLCSVQSALQVYIAANFKGGRRTIGELQRVKGITKRA